MLLIGPTRPEDAARRHGRDLRETGDVLESKRPPTTQQARSAICSGGAIETGWLDALNGLERIGQQHRPRDRPNLGWIRR
jgi:hypothetical protein